MPEEMSDEELVLSGGRNLEVRKSGLVRRGLGLMQEQKKKGLGY